PPPTAVLYPLSLHDALPISTGGTTVATREAELAGVDVVGGVTGGARRGVDRRTGARVGHGLGAAARAGARRRTRASAAAVANTGDRKSTRRNSSHRTIWYAV